MVTERWRIHLFGGLSAERGECRITRFRTEKAGLLLACLAETPNRRFRRDELVERLWPGQPLSSGRNSLRVSLSSLRQQLETRPDERNRLLIADNHQVHLDPAAYTTDKAEFESSLLRAAQAKNEEERAAALESAVEQYPSELLPEYDDLLITAERGRLADAFHLAMRRLVLAHINLRRLDPALAVAQRAVHADPHREESHRLLMQVHALMGRPQAALRQYKDLEALLISEFGSAPSTATRIVLSQLLAGSQAPVAAAAVAARVHAAPDHASAQKERRRSPRLPAPLNPLVGRADAILEVREMLDTPETRLITLVGMGGVGKTRLAIAVAERLRKAGTQICFVELAGLADPSEILSRVATLFHVPLRPRSDLPVRVAEALEAAGAVLFLDNLEHLLPGAADVVSDLMESAPGLTCVVTSRQRLGLPGEYTYPVRPLPLPPGGADAAELTACPSVRLWLDRVRATAPSYRLTDCEAAGVEALSRSLEGLPLAIELAASWAGVLPAGEVASRLASRFDLLISRRAGADGRHASLQAALDWSYQLLACPTQRFLARLGLFRGGWTLEAAQALCPEADALECLAQLEERSFVSTDDAGPVRRYRMLETVRQYADTHLEEREDACREFCGYYAELAEKAAPKLTGPESAGWIRLLADEEPNWRVALAASHDPAAEVGPGLRLSLALYKYWSIRGLVYEGRKWLTVALDRAPDDEPRRAKALLLLGNLASLEGDLDAAESCYLNSQALCAANGDTRGLAAALGALGTAKRRRGRPHEARALALQTLKIFQHCGDVRGEAIALGNLVTACTDLEECAQALSYGERALGLYRALGDRQNEMTALANMSSLVLDLGRTTEAASLLRQSLSLCIELTAEPTLILILHIAARLTAHCGDPATSVRLRAAAARLTSDFRIALTEVDRTNLERDDRAACLLIDGDTGRREREIGRSLSRAELVDALHSVLDTPSDSPRAAGAASPRK
jgi:predicted ATPase/DNA-binding SARP family transcriptional activator